MKKLFFRFFIWLFIFLLSGYSNLSAHQESIGHLTNNTEKTITGLSAVHTVLQPTLKSVSSPVTIKRNDKTELPDNEEEEDELSSHKILSLKKLPGLNYYSSAFYTYTPLYISSRVKKNLPVCRPFFNSCSQRLHIIFRVIRI